MFLMQADPLRGQVGGGWALEIETFRALWNCHKPLKGEGHFGPKKVESISVFTSLSLFPSMAAIASGEEVFAQFKEDSRKQYRRIWSQFRDY